MRHVFDLRVKGEKSMTRDLKQCLLEADQDEVHTPVNMALMATWEMAREALHRWTSTQNINRS